MADWMYCWPGKDTGKDTMLSILILKLFHYNINIYIKQMSKVY